VDALQRRKTIGKGNVSKSLMSDSSVKMSIVAEESVRSSSSVSDHESAFRFVNETGLQSDHSSTESPTSTAEIDNVFDDYDSAYFKDEVDDFSSFFIDSVAYNGKKSSPESHGEKSDDSAKDQTSGIIFEPKMSNKELLDDNILLYKGA